MRCPDSGQVGLPRLVSLQLSRALAPAGPTQLRAGWHWPAIWALSAFFDGYSDFHKQFVQVYAVDGV